MKIWRYDISVDPVPVMFGLLQGIAFFLLRQYQHELGILWHSILTVFFFFGPTAVMLTTAENHRTRDAVFGVALGALLALVFGSYRALLMEPNSQPWDGFGMPLLMVITFSGYVIMVFYQTTRFQPPHVYPYRQLFHHSWNNVLVYGMALVFLGLVWLVLWLWAALFKLIDIRFFDTLFSQRWFSYIASFAILGLGIAVMRSFDPVIASLRRIVLMVFRILSVLVAFAGLLFLLALPFTGLAPLWATRAATAILLSVAGLFVLFVNAAVHEDQDSRHFWLPMDMLVRVFLLALPIYAALAFYATWLRVHQYGLTIERVYALLFVAIAILHAVPYAWSVIARRSEWADGIKAWNPKLAVATVVLSLALHIPGLDPASLSARSQLARFESGRASVAEFDFGYLKFGLGKPGKKALAALQADSELMARPGMSEAMAELAKMNDRFEWQRARFDAEAVPPPDKTWTDVVAAMATLPRGATLPAMEDIEASADLKRLLHQCATRPAEANEITYIPPCALLLLDFNQDGHTDMGVWQGHGSINVYTWNPAKGAYESQRFLYAQGLTLKDLEAAADQGTLRLVPSEIYDLMVGDKRLK
jgi:hypothetical protein